MARTPFVWHRIVRQIWNKYRACREGMVKTRWHAVWLLARTDTPRTPSEVAALVGLTPVRLAEAIR